MSIQLNHTIVWCKDRRRSSEFLTEILGLPKPVIFEPFMVIELENAISLDFKETKKMIMVQHYAFLVTEKNFDEIFSRICNKGLKYWSDPALDHPREINHNDGGRGIYFKDPNGHILEIITRPYGSDK